jgi:hypothetical protein
VPYGNAVSEINRAHVRIEICEISDSHEMPFRISKFLEEALPGLREHVLRVFCRQDSGKIGINELNGQPGSGVFAVALPKVRQRNQSLGGSRVGSAAADVCVDFYVVDSDPVHEWLKGLKPTWPRIKQLSDELSQ